MIRQKPTEAELEILQVLWKEGPSTVRQVNEKLNKIKKVGYTTTLKIMQIMTSKELVKRDMDTRSHIYSVSIEQEETLDLLLDKFLRSTFEGSAMKMMSHLLGSHEPSRREIEEIRSLLDNLDMDKKNGDTE